MWGGSWYWFSKIHRALLCSKANSGRENWNGLCDVMAAVMTTVSTETSMFQLKILKWKIIELNCISRSQCELMLLPLRCSQIHISKHVQAPTLCQRVHRHPPKEEDSIIVGRIHPIQKHISEHIHDPTLCPKGTLTPPKWTKPHNCWQNIVNTNTYLRSWSGPNLVPEGHTDTS